MEGSDSKLQLVWRDKWRNTRIVVAIVVKDEGGDSTELFVSSLLSRLEFHCYDKLDLLFSVFGLKCTHGRMNISLEGAWAIRWNIPEDGNEFK